jgi:hypothetical protein
MSELLALQCSSGPTWYEVVHHKLFCSDGCTHSYCHGDQELVGCRHVQCAGQRISMARLVLRHLVETPKAAALSDWGWSVLYPTETVLPRVFTAYTVAAENSWMNICHYT